MPYLICESCGLRTYTAAGHSTVRECPVCGSPLPRRPPPSSSRSGPGSDADDLRAEIEERVGRIPDCLEPAFANPDVLRELWRQMKRIWLDGPIPPGFREALLGALSEHAPGPWSTIAQVTAAATAQPAAARDSGWPAPATAEYDELLRLTVRLFLDGPEGDIPRRLVELLGASQYASLIAAIAFLQACHTFAEAHPASTGVSRRGRPARTRTTAIADMPGRLAFEGAPVGMALVSLESDGPGVIAEVNRAMTVVTGRSRADLVGHSFSGFTDPADADADADLLARLLEGAIPSYSVNKRLVRGDGETFWGELSIALIRDEDSRTPRYLVVQLDDISERRRVADALQTSRERLAGVFAEAPLGMGLATLDSRWIEVNPALCETFACDEAELLNRPLQELIAPEDVGPLERYIAQLVAGEVVGYHVETRAIRADGQRIWVQLSMSLVHPEQAEPAYLFVETHDISERKRLEQELEQGALLDATTGLSSRTLLFDRLEQACARAERTGMSFAVMFVQTHGLEEVESQLGRPRADAAEREIGARLQTAVRSGDTVARYTQDEFVILCEDLESQDEASSVVARVLELGQLTVSEGSAQIEIAATVGLTMGGAGNDSPAALVERADAAMQAAKREGVRYEEYWDSV
jgi:PAS domain S-box-containing protein/diguanylate cyclase (GGDEF)-like protein